MTSIHATSILTPTDTVRDFFKRPEVEDAVVMVVCALAAFIAARLGKKL